MTGRLTVAGAELVAALQVDPEVQQALRDQDPRAFAAAMERYDPRLTMMHVGLLLLLAQQPGRN